MKELKISQRKSDKSNTELYKKAIHFFVDELLSKSKQSKLKLKVIFKKFTGKCRQESGSCYQNSRNSYIVEVNRNKPFISIIGTLAHELTHVKQGVNGKLILKTNGFIWNKKLYKSIDIPEEEYDNKPWEKEAYALETELTLKFFKTIIIDEVKTANE